MSRDRIRHTPAAASKKDAKPDRFPLDPPTANAVEALADCFARLIEADLDEHVAAPPHLVARARAQTAPTVERARDLSQMVLARALGDSSAPTDDTMRDTARSLENELEAALQLLDDPSRTPRRLDKRASRKARMHALYSAGTLFHEVALEERGIDAILGGTSDGKPIVLTLPIDPAKAFTRSFEPLYQFLELRAESYGLLALERIASEWWFDTWSASRRPNVDTRSHWYREREFSFFDRVMLSLGESLASWTVHYGDASKLPVRQRALLTAVRRSVCSLFIVRERRGAVAVLEDIEMGDSYEIREHSPELMYDVGFVVGGRLIHTPQFGWLRSPGTIMWRIGAAAAAGVLAEPLRDLKAAAPAGVAVESLIALAGRGQQVPRFVQPASSRREAAMLFAHFHDSMWRIKIARDLDGLSSLPAEIRAFTEAAGRMELQVPTDLVLRDWTRALGAQAGISAQAQGDRKFGVQAEARRREQWQ